MGAFHDGRGIVRQLGVPCPTNEQYVMHPFASSDVRKIVWSPCSENIMQIFLKYVSKISEAFILIPCSIMVYFQNFNHYIKICEFLGVAFLNVYGISQILESLIGKFYLKYTPFWAT